MHGDRLERPAVGAEHVLFFTILQALLHLMAYRKHERAVRYQCVRNRPFMLAVSHWTGFMITKTWWRMTL